MQSVRPQREGVCGTGGTTGGRTQWKGINGSHQKQVEGGTQSFSASPRRALMGPRFRLSQRKDRIFIQMKPPLLALKGVSRNLWGCVLSPSAQPLPCGWATRTGKRAGS